MTPRCSMEGREDVLLQSADRIKTSNTFYSSNCISNSEKSLFNFFVERESINFENNNFNTNFISNNFNNYKIDDYIYNSNNSNNNKNSGNLIRTGIFSEVSTGKNSKANIHSVRIKNGNLHIKEKEKEVESSYSNANAGNNSQITLSCMRLTADEKEAKSAVINFDIPFVNEDLKEENAFEAAVIDDRDNINEKSNYININNNNYDYNFESSKKKQQLKKQKITEENEESNLNNKAGKSQTRKASNKNIDLITKISESGKVI